MKNYFPISRRFSGSTCFAVLLGWGLLVPAGTVQPQLTASPNDPTPALQQLLQANAELLKRQEATLGQLQDAAQTAQAIRFLVKRG